jgi:sugar lactone lactonase YvrE
MGLVISYLTIGNGCPDGVHDDVQGHRWAAMARLGGILQSDPRGIMLGCVPVPNGDLWTTHCAFGGRTATTLI